MISKLKILNFFLCLVLTNIFFYKDLVSKYISVTAAVSTSDFEALEQALNEVRPELIRAGLQIEPISQKKYHMTLLGFNLVINPKFSSKRQNNLVKIVQKKFNKVVQETLDSSKKFTEFDKLPSINKFGFLKFAYIGIFQKKIVAIFEISKVLQELIDSMEACLMNSLKDLILDGDVITINKHQVAL